MFGVFHVCLEINGSGLYGAQTEIMRIDSNTSDPELLLKDTVIDYCKNNGIKGIVEYSYEGIVKGDSNEEMLVDSGYSGVGGDEQINKEKIIIDDCLFREEECICF